MLDGQPEWGRFQGTVGSLIEKLQAKPNRTLRAYGEILRANSFHLFCPYSIDLRGQDFHARAVPTPLEPSEIASTSVDSLRSTPSRC